MMLDRTRFDALIQDLDHADMRIRSKAREQLLAHGYEAVESLIATLQGSNLRIRWQALNILSEINDPRAIEPIRALLGSSHTPIAQSAVLALEKAIGVKILDDLIDLLPRSPMLVQLTIIQAIERINDPRGVAPLTELLRSTDLPEIRYTTIQALGKLGDPQVIALIQSFQADENDHVRERTTIALARLQAARDQDLDKDKSLKA